MSERKDPRVLFAAERTLLAWNRTSLSLVAFGFVLERAGLLVPATHANKAHFTLTFCLGVSFARPWGTYARLFGAAVRRRPACNEQSHAQLGPQLCLRLQLGVDGRGMGARGGGAWGEGVHVVRALEINPDKFTPPAMIRPWVREWPTDLKIDPAMLMGEELRITY